jgi:hypothetical protein
VAFFGQRPFALLLPPPSISFAQKRFGVTSAILSMENSKRAVSKARRETEALMTRTSLLLPFAALAGLAVPAMADIGFEFQSVINPADTNFTQLLGINNSGLIAGYFGDGTAVPNNGFTLVLPSSFTPENFPGTPTLTEAQTQVVGINNMGETVGFWIDTAGGTHGFTKVGPTFTNVDNPNALLVMPPLTQLLGVNDSSEAAGYYTNTAGNFAPFTLLTGTFTPVPVPGLVSAQATDVNNAGDVVGFNMPTPTTSDGFLDIGGTFTKLDFPGSMFTQALGLNNNGLVVGDYVDGAGVMHGFVYTIATGTYQSVDDPTAVADGGTTTINGINDNNQIVGFYTTGATIPGTMNPVTIGLFANAPEPRSLLLLGTILLSIAVFKLRKRRA